MTSKLKCPVCNVPLTECGDLLFCPNDHCAWAGNAELWRALIQAKQDLEKSEKCCSAWETQALDYKAETIALSGKLEIATKALEDIKTVCDNCHWCESNIYTPDSHDGRIIAETTNKAIKQIEHKE